MRWWTPPSPARFPRPARGAVAVVVAVLLLGASLEAGATTVEPTSNAAVAAVGLPVPPLGTNDWLSWLNWLRALNGWAPAREDPALSVGPANHVRYLSLNGGCTHTQDPTRPGYQPNSAHQVLSCGLVGAAALMAWVVTPYHSVLTDPTITTFGYAAAGSYAAMQLGPRAGGTSTWTWPADGGWLPALNFPAGEVPDPLTTDCAGRGWTYPLAPAVFAALPGTSGLPNTAVAGTLHTSSGEMLETCVFVRGGRVVMLARRPFVAGQRYTAALSNGTSAVRWSFTAFDVAVPASVPAPLPASPTVAVNAAASPSTAALMAFFRAVVASQRRCRVVRSRGRLIRVGACRSRSTRRPPQRQPVRAAARAARR